MKKIILLLPFLVVSKVMMAQSSGKLFLKKGMVIETELISYKTPMLEDAAGFLKKKPGKRDAAVLEYNDEIATGKVSPTAKMVLPTTISEVQDNNGETSYTGIVRIGVSDYNLRIKASPDSVKYLINNAAPFPIISKGDTTGIWVYGPRVFPANPEVGTYFSGYVNEMSLFPWDLKTSRRTFMQFDGGDGYAYRGYVNMRKTVVMSSSSIILNTPFYVTGKEQMTIAGRTYTVYRLLNAQWMKSTTNSVVKEDPNVYFDDEQLSKAIKLNLESRGRGWDTKEKIDKLLKASADKIGLYNEYGYIENFQESWYAPELGMIVRTRFYDPYGALQMESVVKSIK